MIGLTELSFVLFSTKKCSARQSYQWLRSVTDLTARLNRNISKNNAIETIRTHEDGKTYKQQECFTVCINPEFENAQCFKIQCHALVSWITGRVVRALASMILFEIRGC